MVKVGGKGKSWWLVGRISKRGFEIGSELCGLGAWVLVRFEQSEQLLFTQRLDLD